MASLFHDMSCRHTSMSSSGVSREATCRHVHTQKFGHKSRVCVYARPSKVVLATQPCRHTSMSKSGVSREATCRQNTQAFVTGGA